MSDVQGVSWSDATGVKGGPAGGGSAEWLVARIYFPVSSARLDSADEAVLIALARSYGPLLLGQAVQFRCVGAADASGAASANLSLGLSRARAVHDALLPLFKTVRNFSAAQPGSVGESGATSSSDPDKRAADRRVDVFATAVVSVAPPPVVDTRIAVRQAIIQAHGIVEHKTWGQFKPVAAELADDWDYESIVIHHSGNWGVKVPREIEMLHMTKHRWPDVGYHYMIHPGGTIYEGRSILHKGAHVAGANSRKIGVLMMGDYDEQWWDDDDELTPRHIDELRGLITTLKKQFTGVKYLGGHTEFAAAQGDERTCPGNLLLGKMPGLRSEFSLAAPAAPAP